MSEDMIIYGNRYRSSYPEIDQGLEKATTLFYKGQYEEAYQTALNVIKFVENKD